MKTLKIFLVVLLISTISIFKLLAQEGMEDVVYLKSGSIYRGMIIEQVPNTSLKIQIAGGSVVAINISDVTKITKEAKLGQSNGEDRFAFPWHHHADSAACHATHKQKGYFFQSQLLIENLQGGVRIINGYRFNQHAALGIGVGFDYVKSSPFHGLVNNLPKSDYSGVYLPLYLYLTGDAFNRRITPFYAVEAGYTMYRGSGDPFDGGMGFGKNMQGGPMGGIGLGVKFYTPKRVNLSLLADLNVKDLYLNQTNTLYTPSGNPYTVTQKVQTIIFFPGIRFGVGF